MCLELNNKKTNKLKEDFKETNSKYVKVYKVIAKEDYKKEYLLTPYTLKKIKPGIIKSNRRTVNYPIKSDNPISLGSWKFNGEELIKTGIHIFFTKNSANSYKTFFEKVLECKALKKDFVGCNKTGKHAVFLKIFLTKKEHDRVLKIKRWS